MSQLERDDSLSENLLQILDPILPEIGTKLRHVRSAIAPAATAAKRTACLYIMTEKMYVVVGSEWNIARLYTEPVPCPMVASNM